MAFDLPGFGYSDMPGLAAFDYDFDVYAEVLTAVTKHLGLTRYALYRDNLRGDHGGNILQELAGNDRLYGGNGHDRLLGGAGADRLSGGAGSDIFVFLSAREASLSSRDVICDFAVGQDRVDLRSIDANFDVAGDQAFSYIGAETFSATACELRFGSGLLHGRIDGDSVGDLLVELVAVSILSGHDLLL